MSCEALWAKQQQQQMPPSGLNKVKQFAVVVEQEVGLKCVVLQDRCTRSTAPLNDPNFGEYFVCFYYKPSSLHRWKFKELVTTYRKSKICNQTLKFLLNILNFLLCYPIILTPFVSTCNISVCINLYFHEEHS
jgi:hypothetical protein